MSLLHAKGLALAATCDVEAYYVSGMLLPSPLSPPESSEQFRNSPAGTWQT